jgi:hypothetical protein
MKVFETSSSLLVFYPLWPVYHHKPLEASVVIIIMIRLKAMSRRRKGNVRMWAVARGVKDGGRCEEARSMGLLNLASV